MSLRLKNLLFVPFLLYLFIYAHSEGDRLPTFLFIVFTSLWILELISFLWFRHTTRLNWSVPDNALEAGSPLTIILSCRSAKLALGLLQTRFQIPWNLSDGKSLIYAIQPRPGQHEYSLSFLADPRGRYEIGPLFAWYEDPLGIFRTQVRIGSAQEIWLTPRLIPLKDFPLSAQELEIWSGNQTLTGQVSCSARKYQAGDPWQNIHWKATARSQTLMVREFETSPALKTVLWLDLSSQSYGENDKALEAAISLTASLLTHYYQRRQPLICFISSQKPASFPFPEEKLHKALKFLAGAKADRIQPVEQIPESLPLADRLILVTKRYNPVLVNRLSSRHGNTCRILLLLSDVGPNRPADSHINVRHYNNE